MTNGQYSLINTRGMSSAREMRAFKRTKEIERLGLKRKPAPPKRYALPNYCSNIKDTEFHFPEEPRNWTVLSGPCPSCAMNRPHLLQRKPSKQGVSKYRVECSSVKCNYATPWLPSSQAAIQLWKVTAALVK